MEARNEQTLELTAFVQICLNGKVLEEHELNAPVLSIGRSTDCDIVINNAAVSAFHAMLSYRNGKLRIEDAASTNGIMADGSKSSAIELSPGDSAQIAGKYSLRLVETPSGGTTPRDVVQSQTSGEPQAETMLVSTTTLAKMSQRTRPAYLTMSQTGRPSWIVRLDKSVISIGRKGDIRIGGWLAPAEIASVERRDDGFHLVPKKTDEVMKDGKALEEPCQLGEGDRFQIKDVVGVFHERTNSA